MRSVLMSSCHQRILTKTRLGLSEYWFPKNLQLIPKKREGPKSSPVRSETHRQLTWTKLCFNVLCLSRRCQRLSMTAQTMLRLPGWDGMRPGSKVVQIIHSLPFPPNHRHLSSPLIIVKYSYDLKSGKQSIRHLSQRTNLEGYRACTMH